MIYDAHCHVWELWPHLPEVPDSETRGTMDQLIFEMDRNGVDKALIVCAEINNNSNNNQYAFDRARDYPDRVRLAVDVDSRWKSSHHQEGAAERLETAIERWNPVAISHYLSDEADDGAWLHSAEGRKFIEVMREHGLIFSIHCLPQHQADLRKMAQDFPGLTILIHHMGQASVLAPEALAEVMATAVHDNVHVKVSGFYCCTAQPKWDFPLADAQSILRMLYQRYGGSRLVWGSDFPVCRRNMTYQQTLEIVRHHCRFIPAADMDKLMGDNLAALIKG